MFNSRYETICQSQPSFVRTFKKTNWKNKLIAIKLILLQSRENFPYLE